MLPLDEVCLTGGGGAQTGICAKSDERSVLLFHTNKNMSGLDACEKELPVQIRCHLCTVTSGHSGSPCSCCLVTHGILLCLKGRTSEGTGKSWAWKVREHLAMWSMQPGRDNLISFFTTPPPHRNRNDICKNVMVFTFTRGINHRHSLLTTQN